jgi:hypothetical protein
MPGQTNSGHSAFRRQWVLAALLVLEAAVFVWHVKHFFNGDSLFYLSHRITSWSGAMKAFCSCDSRWQYRPLTYLVFSFVLFPLFGMNPVPYNLFGLGVHMLNTLLVYRVLLGFSQRETAALLGAFFFGIHTAAFYIAYDGITFLPESSYAFFSLLAILFHRAYCQKGRALRLWASLLAFVLALLSKETAVVLPAVVWLGLVFCDPAATKRLWQGGRIRAHAKRVLPLCAVALLYLLVSGIIKKGVMYPLSPSHSHNYELSWYALRLKYKYLKWALNFPDGLIFEFVSWSNYLVAMGVALFTLPFTLALIRGLARGNRKYWFAASWFLIFLSPVLLLRNLTMVHYLYLPVVGVAFALGLWLDELRVRGGRARRTVFFAAFALTTIAAAVHHNRQAARTSWIAEASRVAESALGDLRKERPRLPEKAGLLIVNGSSRDLDWFFDYGNLFRLFYNEPELEVLFVKEGAPMPKDFCSASKWIVLRYDGAGLREMEKGRGRWRFLLPAWGSLKSRGSKGPS